MALKKPTIINCIDGKDHAWMIVCEEIDAQNVKWEHRWCQKCGVLTQVTYDATGQPIAVMAADNQPFLIVPKVLDLVVKQ